MNLNDMTRDQLKVEAKKRGLTKYHAWSGAKLIQEITKFDTSSGVIENPADQEVVTEPAAAPIPTVQGAPGLSPQALKWKEYFVKTNTTPVLFLQRYPNHKFKLFISELL